MVFDQKINNINIQFQKNPGISGRKSGLAIQATTSRKNVSMAKENTDNAC